ncbi:hypothetical protein [Streptococcus danieliae]|uniref:hypothetical protein n=1 Tax=Streptococcus danieliae TaxID=747656 RepID=UPI0021C6F927|nr:hypothetical protein [Streptococcus danieliae]MCU0082596.1 hypothetical protein [Streptococcus danieliae]
MSLLDIANAIKKEGFDPRKDSANGPAPIPAGTYPVVLKKATFDISEKGWESLGYQFEIRDGEYSGRSEFVRFGTLEEWNGKSLSWAVERTVKFFQKAIALANDEAYKKDFEDGKTMEEALQRKAVGTYYNLVVEVTQGKGDKTYRSYDLLEDEYQPVQPGEIDDDDLPF